MRLLKRAGYVYAIAIVLSLLTALDALYHHYELHHEKQACVIVEDEQDVPETGEDRQQTIRNP
jgi:hypothetical protein